MARKTKTTNLEITEAAALLAKKNRKKLFLILLIIGLLILISYKKGLLFAATVNNEPITTFELIQKLYVQGKERTINQMVNEKLLEQEAKKAGVKISAQEVEQKVADLEKQYGGKEGFEALLSQQGLNRDAVYKDTKFQLIVERLYEKEASPSSEDIQKFMEANKDNPEATDEAKFKQFATEQIKQQNLTKVFQEKFQELRSKAKITIF
ncbi:MAG: SurA domain-containing protein [Microgenomates group bacterium Gr01-1014_93]|nr:MAG: SurA domain-containing protein [Microgenomates group bacterium Gr01-1014_93]